MRISRSKFCKKCCPKPPSRIRLYLLGMGRNDQAAASHADYVFAVKDLPLAKTRQAENLATFEFADFGEVLGVLEGLHH